MAIICGYPFDYVSTTIVGKARIVTCRTPRFCDDCKEPINIKEIMYIQSMYDWHSMKPSQPLYWCEKCGDLVESLFEAGYDLEFDGEGIRRQWKEHVEAMKHN